MIADYEMLLEKEPKSVVFTMSAYVEFLTCLSSEIYLPFNLAVKALVAMTDCVWFLIQVSSIVLSQGIGLDRTFAA